MPATVTLLDVTTFSPTNFKHWKVRYFRTWRDGLVHVVYRAHVLQRKDWQCFLCTGYMFFAVCAEPLSRSKLFESPVRAPQIQVWKSDLDGPKRKLQTQPRHPVKAFGTPNAIVKWPDIYKGSMLPYFHYFTPSPRFFKLNFKDYRLTIEYKHLKQNAPGGVFVIPSVNHLRIWYGVIFVRRGHYANGIFKFRCVDWYCWTFFLSCWKAVYF